MESGLFTYQLVTMDADSQRRAQADLIALLRDVVEGGASVGFVTPVTDMDATAFWTRVADETAAGKRVVIGALVNERVIGCIHLYLGMPLNGQHRAEVQKMLVHSDFRRRGIATALLRAADSAAIDAKRTLLFLDTERDSAAEAMYERYGYTRAGIIPDYALNGRGEKLIVTVLLYRKLP